MAYYVARPHNTAMRYNPQVVMAYFRECGLPPCVAEHRFHPTRGWRFDFAWADFAVALEIDGGVWTRGAHGRGSGIVRDIEKYNAAVVSGWRVLRCQPRELMTMDTVRTVRSALMLAADALSQAREVIALRTMCRAAGSAFANHLDARRNEREHGFCDLLARLTGSVSPEVYPSHADSRLEIDRYEALSKTIGSLIRKQ